MPTDTSKSLLYYNKVCFLYLSPQIDCKLLKVNDNILLVVFVTSLFRISPQLKFWPKMDRIHPNEMIMTCKLSDNFHW